MSFLICSNIVCVRALTWAQVRLNRPIGAVLRAETIEVSVEKLFIARHF